MGKKRKCRYTEEELAIHDEAVRLRKMTDKQLVEEFHRARDTNHDADGRRASQEAQKKKNPKNDTPALEKLLEGLAEGKCKGIKGATVYKITEFAKEMGLI